MVFSRLLDRSILQPLVLLRLDLTLSVAVGPDLALFTTGIWILVSWHVSHRYSSYIFPTGLRANASGLDVWENALNRLVSHPISLAVGQEDAELGPQEMTLVLRTCAMR